MDNGVSRRRHLAASNQSADTRKDLLLLFDRILAPMGEVHVASRLSDVAFDQPGHRRDVTVPRPFGLFGMTVLTGPLDHLQNEGIDRGTGQQRLSRFSGLHRAAGMN